MNRPTTLRLGHQRIKIKWLHEGKWLKKWDPDKCGHYWYMQQVITVRLENSGVPYKEEVLREILAHELIHVFWEHGAAHSMGNVSEEDVEEVTTTHLTIPFLTAMQDNPDVFDYLMGRAEPVD